MVSSSSSSNKTSASSTETDSAVKYRGVRKRNWGKWVSEIRLPNSRERIWLGSYDSAEKAARAFDAALFCLRGPAANFNFPNCPPDIPGGMSFSRSQIQSAAAEFANQSWSYYSPSCSESQQTTTTTACDELDCSSSSFSVSDSLMFSDMFVSSSGLDVSVSDYGFFDELGFVDYCYQGAAFDEQPQVVNYSYDVEDYPQLWNF